MHVASTIRDVDRLHLELVDHGEGYMIYQDHETDRIMVHRLMITVDHWTQAFVITKQRADAMARKINSRARLIKSTDYGVVSIIAERRVYKIGSDHGS